MLVEILPDSNFYGANMGPIWGRQDPDGPHVSPMNFAIWACLWMDATILYQYNTD